MMSGSSIDLSRRDRDDPRILTRPEPPGRAVDDLRCRILYGRVANRLIPCGGGAQNVIRPMTQPASRGVDAMTDRFGRRPDGGLSLNRRDALIGAATLGLAGVAPRFAA